MEATRPVLSELPRNLDCLVVIVTHNSSKYIQWCLDGLRSAKSELAIRIVDSGSEPESYLDELTSPHYLQVLRCANIGFVAANNLAIELTNHVQWILFLNPDAHVDGAALDQILEVASSSQYSKTGIFTVPLVRFDIEKRQTLNIYDSVGIASTWYGRWKDLLSGRSSSSISDEDLWRLKTPEAICGAFMLARNSALNTAIDSTGARGFERKYYMYKEDIELSLRMNKFGWRLTLLPQFFAYHCRGWKKRRSAVPYWARVESAKNDFDVALKYRRFAIPFTALKYLWVKAMERE